MLIYENQIASLNERLDAILKQQQEKDAEAKIKDQQIVNLTAELKALRKKLEEMKAKEGNIERRSNTSTGPFYHFQGGS